MTDKLPKANFFKRLFNTESLVKGGAIQVLPTSGTTTITQEMADLVKARMPMHKQKPPSAHSVKK